VGSANIKGVLAGVGPAQPEAAIRCAADLLLVAIGWGSTHHCHLRMTAAWYQHAVDISMASRELNY